MSNERDEGDKERCPATGMLVNETNKYVTSTMTMTCAISAEERLPHTYIPQDVEKTDQLVWKFDTSLGKLSHIILGLGTRGGKSQLEETSASTDIASSTTVFSGRTRLSSSRGTLQLVRPRHINIQPF